VFGVTDITEGVPRIGNGSEFEDAEPEFTTTISALPTLAIRLAPTDAVTCVVLTKVVGSPEPFHCTVAPGSKAVPYTVSVKAAPPTAAELGERLVIEAGEQARIASAVRGVAVDGVKVGTTVAGPVSGVSTAGA
jgi:hypothetical protein